MGYKVRFDGSSGFPEIALSKVVDRLEVNKISYELIYKDRKSIIKNYKNVNTYNKVLTRAFQSESYKVRIDNIISKINAIEDINKLNDILGVIENELSQ